MSEARCDDTPVWYLYVIETAGGALYTGITTDVERRFREHCHGKRGARALRGKGPLTLRHCRAVGIRSEALRLEAWLKKQPVAKKRAWLEHSSQALSHTTPAEPTTRQGADMTGHLEGIRLVAFDLDGTLIDSVPDLARAVDCVLAAQQLPPAGEAKVRDWVGNGARKLVERALADALGAAEAARRLDGAQRDFLAAYAQAPCVDTTLYPGAREALERLKARGMQLALITNKPHAFIAPILGALGLEGLFDVTLGGDSLPVKKPDPAPLLHAAEILGVTPQASLMVGDSRHDIEAGRRAGFRTLAVPYGYNHGEAVADAGPDGLVESLIELV
ncbi:phosphoglycolate phosphatase [Halomonas sp. HP20-15]|uniref:phosphoglycolate phosphatase n=1 Tax=Halomonas sp. HP20-15 TaxID=3085901 RepID=UPI002980A312|nr:phosphoglycolate phosphatase [Halomonas sp. HP20-15]MDW5376791.1 phosphoglycolate phosphatase [Halomonas sp. HP20-15]